MHATRKITENITWVGANDRRLAMFEGVYSVPAGVSYNSYLVLDDKTILFDTVDHAVSTRFMENVVHTLAGRPLDYLVVQHMEPDHGAGIQGLVALYPALQIVCNQKTAGMLAQFFDFEVRTHIVAEGDVLSTGRHNFTFVMAPMVHWPEVMMTYESTEKILFSADAFGCFGALNGSLFAHEVDFFRDYLDEARRYYSNIVGKYGPQVLAVLKKAQGLDIQMICPLHGFVWQGGQEKFVEKYLAWASYTPEEKGVVIAYASIYGNTENAAEVLAIALREKGVKTVMFDTSVTNASDIISACFKYSHFVFAAPTYNNGIFVTMDAFLRDLVAHNIKNRTVGFIENGSWASQSGGLMRGLFEKSAGITVLEPVVKITSSVKDGDLVQIEALVDAVVGSM